MHIQTDRFGALDLDDGDAIQFPEGLIGFPSETEFVLLRHRKSSPIGWLQSTKTAWFALPVVSIEALTLDFNPAMLDLPAFRPETHALMAVLNASNGALGATVNMLAPVVVNVETRSGRQVVCVGSEWSPNTPFALRAEPEADMNEDSAPNANATMAAVAASP